MKEEGLIDRTSAARREVKGGKARRAGSLTNIRGARNQRANERKAKKKGRKPERKQEVRREKGEWEERGVLLIRGAFVDKASWITFNSVSLLPRPSTIHLVRTWPGQRRREYINYPDISWLDRRIYSALALPFEARPRTFRRCADI